MKFLLVLISVVLGAREDASFLDEDFLDQLYGPVDKGASLVDQAAFEKLHRTPAGGALAQALQIMKEIPAQKLPLPRAIPYVSSETLVKNLQNSFVSFCPDEMFETNACVCKDRYSSIATLRNATEESLAVVTTDETERQIVVSYRPTRTLKNQFSNMDFELVQYPDAPQGVLVHRGFKDYHYSIKDQAEEEVYKLLKNPHFRGFDLQITGYSLGGGISIVSAPSWTKFMRRHHFINRLLIFSYAGPRVGNEPFAQYLANMNIPITRYSNRGDLVSHVPIRSLGYVHVGVEYHERIQAHGKPELVLCSQDFDEDPSCGLNPSTLISIARHYFPFQNYLPLPPYC